MRAVLHILRLIPYTCGMGADFKAFQTYVDIGWDNSSSYLSIPRNGEGPTRNYFLFNLASSSFGEAQKELNIAALGRHLAEVPGNLIHSIPASLLSEEKMTARSFVDRSISNPQSLEFLAAVTLPQDGMVFIDQRATDAVSEGFLRHLPAEERTLFTPFARHHEAAHLMLQTQEAGSDFVASVLLLREQPESRDMLRSMADMRLLTGMLLGEKDYKLYGAECHDAIEHALSLSPEKIRSLSLEEMHAIGSTFDARNDKNAAMDYSPEAEARGRLSPVSSTFDIRRGLKQAWNHATGNMPDFGDVISDLSKGNLSELGQKIENALPSKGDLRKMFQKEYVLIADMEKNLPHIMPDQTTEAGRILEDVREALIRKNQQPSNVQSLTH